MAGPLNPTLLFASCLAASPGPGPGPGPGPDPKIATQTSTTKTTATTTTATTASNPPEPEPEPEPDDDIDPLKHGLTFSLLDGAWSILVTGSWAIVGRAWDAPQPNGLAGIAAARILYGTPWSILLSSEVGLARIISGPRWAGIRDAQFRVDWLFGYAVPGPCPRGAPFGSGSGGCGLGLGGMNDVRARISRRWPWLEAGLAGGWLEGRVLEDARRTLAESTWILTPFRLMAVDQEELGASVKFSFGLGPLLAFGMHNAHLHPRPNSGIDAPIYEIQLREAGIGPGLRGEVRLSFFERVSLEAEVELAILAGGSGSEPIEGLASPQHRPISWRTASLGLGFQLDQVHLSTRGWWAELSSRPFSLVGHRALLIRFEVPLPLPDDQREVR